ncbi:MAG: hypothetical protein GF334_05345 [Candidatus Altiarchaeales archaeon]|nr:hypothetical protein [Candidatus Altiarchaeales archaeon]
MTSRRLRRKARQLCHEAKGRYHGEGYNPYDGDADVYLDDPQDQRRGKAGSRSLDWGWDYFGDGRVRIIVKKLEPREHMIAPHEEWLYESVRGRNLPWKSDRELAKELSRK